MIKMFMELEVSKMCIGEITEEDMLHKLLLHEERGHDEDDEDAGRVVFSWKREQESALERRGGMGIWRIGIGRIRKDEGTRMVGGLAEIRIRTGIGIGIGNASSQSW